MPSDHYRVNSGKKGTAKNHARYITREGKFSDLDDLVTSWHGNLPDWANGDPLKAWDASDKFERSGGSAYRERVLALPKELNFEQNCELVRRLVNAIIGDNKFFQVAVHAPQGSLEKSGNPHTHIMSSDRVDDGISRPPEQMHKRYNSKQPELGGRRKDSGGKTKIEVRDTMLAERKIAADIQNQMLAECGIDARVDYRSLHARGVMRRPEQRLAVARIKNMNDEEKSEFSAMRKLKPETV